MAEASQPRRSRRFSFTSRRPQSAVVTEEIKSQPPVTTIGFPIDALPLYSEAQQERPTSSWRNAFRRSQSVDRTNSRAPSADRRSSRRLVKKQPGNGSRRDTSVSSQTPTLPNVPILSNISTRIQSRRGSVSNNARDEDVVPYTNQQAAPPQQYGYDRIRSNTTANAQREQQKNDHAIMKDLPPAPATPTLRRVGSPFYHTAADKSAMSFNPAATTVGVEQRKGSIDTTHDDSMIPASLRVGRSNLELEGQTRDRASSPMQENPAYHSLPKYSPSDAPAQQANYDSITSLMEAVTFPDTSNAPEQISAHTPDAVESVNKRDERIKNLRPLKTMSPRPHHAKTPSSSSSSSYGSSTFSALGEPATPVSSNASTTNFETTSISTKSNTSRKEIPRNTMSPKHDKYLAKIFVVCCHCNYWHDVPSGMYAQMVIPECLLFSGLPEPSSSRSSRSSSQARSAKSSASKPQSIFSETSSSSGPSSSPKATVKCSWCKHEMAKSCCASWTTMVHLIEKHH